ncbi:DUF4345 domain-containing protein [Methylocapsa aurea]|uniref:DUF4345 domain-containing protein n=1 Tax=Methylocapsa aurea TaxID=663610 RepID=UPI00068A097B|nr:DUF4345 domain-containing protein [Methylocapsa aurea]
MTKRPLQITTFVLALVPIVTGALGMMGLDDPLYASIQLPRDATLDSNLRFYAGAWFGLGLAALWLIPRIERETALFRVLWLMIFFGGLGRLFSLILVGLPFPPFVGFTLLELIGAPCFIWWQSRVASAGLSKSTIEGRGR